jgi:hypothetical protein
VKANYGEFDTKLPLEEVGAIFQQAVKRRPLKLMVARFKFFTPTKSEDPFEALVDSPTPDFSVGAGFQFPGPDPAMGTVILNCLRRDGGTLVSLRSTGNVRGRIFTNALMKHLLNMFHEADPQIDPEKFSGSL